MHRQYHQLRDQMDKLNIEKEELVSKNKSNEQKIINLEQQVIRMQSQNHELKLRLNQDMPILQERLQSSIIPSQPSRSLLRREVEARQANQQIQRNIPHFNEFVLGPGQRQQHQSDSSMVIIPIKDSIPSSQAELIEYCCIVKIEKKVKSGVNEKQATSVDKEKEEKSSAD